MCGISEVGHARGCEVFSKTCNWLLGGSPCIEGAGHITSGLGLAELLMLGTLIRNISQNPRHVSWWDGQHHGTPKGATMCLAPKGSWTPTPVSLKDDHWISLISPRNSRSRLHAAFSNAWPDYRFASIPMYSLATNVKRLSTSKDLVASGKRLHNYGQPQFLLGKSTINIYKRTFSIANC
jgi:hypothetical protein